MKRVSLFIILALCALGSLGALHFAQWETSLGNLVADIYDQWVPITANNFISLTNSGFYNDLIFHRVVAGFVIQDGCPQGTGYGGPGYTIPDEFHPNLFHNQAGILAMARTSAPNSAGSQYYITLAPTPNLNGNYAVFGKVIEGLDTVLAIGQVPVDANDRPLTPVNIHTLRMLDLAIFDVTPSDSTAFHIGVDEELMFVIEMGSGLLTDFVWKVDGVESPGMDFIFETSFPNPGTHSVSCLISNADISHEIVWEIIVEGSSSGENLIPVSDLRIWPQPLREGVKIGLGSADADEYRVAVHDLKGRLLFQLPGSLKHGSHIYWDGRDPQGKRLPAGLYFIRAASGRQSQVKRCLIL